MAGGWLLAAIGLAVAAGPAAAAAASRARDGLRALREALAPLAGRARGLAGRAMATGRSWARATRSSASWLWRHASPWAQAAALSVAALSVAASLWSVCGVAMGHAAMAGTSGLVIESRKDALLMGQEARDAVLAASQRSNALASCGSVAAAYPDGGLGGHNGHADADIPVLGGSAAGAATLTDGLSADGQAIPGAWVDAPTAGGARLPAWVGSAPTALDGVPALSRVPWSALPVGGRGTLCAWADRRGALSGLRRGDIITVWALCDAYSYRVESVDEVPARQVAKAIAAQEGRDLVAIVGGWDPQGLPSAGAMAEVTIASRVPYAEALEQRSRVGDLADEGLSAMTVAAMLSSGAASWACVVLAGQRGPRRGARGGRGQGRRRGRPRRGM